MGLCITFGKQRNQKLSKNEFHTGCQKHGWKIREAVDVVFQMYGDLDTHGRETRKLEISNLEALDRWNVPEYFFADADDDGFSQLKKELLGWYNGNALAAWRKDFDRDGSMRVNYEEFREICKKLESRTGQTLNTAGVWRALDSNLSDWVSLGEFDVKAYKALSDFKRDATAQFGSCKRFIEQIERQPVNRTTFRKALLKSGIWQQDPSRSSSKEVLLDTSNHLEGAQARAPEEFASTSGSNSEKMAQQLHKQEELKRAADELFEALDVDNSGTLTPSDVLCLDRWNVVKDEAEEKAWQSILNMQMAMRTTAKAQMFVKNSV